MCLSIQHSIQMILFKFGNLIRNIVGESISGECHFKLASVSLLAPPHPWLLEWQTPQALQGSSKHSWQTFSQTQVGNMEGLKDPLGWFYIHPSADQEDIKKARSSVNGEQVEIYDFKICIVDDFLMAFILSLSDITFQISKSDRRLSWQKYVPTVDMGKYIWTRPSHICT